MLLKFAPAALLAAAFFFPSALFAQEGPYFVAYDQHMEEPGNLEVSLNSLAGSPSGGNSFLAPWTEIEYGATAWWTTEFYLDSQHTTGQGTLFTGWRIENRIRPLAGEHWITPVLYLEYENITEADKTIKEVVGFDSQADGALPNSVTGALYQHEIETKLLLGSDFRGWNVSENFVAEKNLGPFPWEFGYAFGFNRPLALAASARDCALCLENFRLGAEFYGGLGDARAFTISSTAHYAAPILAWNVPSGFTLRISPTWGLTSTSYRFLFRFGISREFQGFGPALRRLFQ